MSGQDEAAPNAETGKAKQTRERSTIAFPYADLESAIELAEAIFRNVGGGECDDSQLAAWSNQSAKSSTFRVQIYAARTYGILGGDGPRHSLTDLGSAIVDLQRKQEAKVRAFLAVPLFSAIFEKFKGGALPPAAALEREMVGLGVAQKQKERARQVFEKSAEQAGFTAHGKDRLVQPGVLANNTSHRQPPPPAVKHSGGDGGAGAGGSGSGSGSGTGNEGLDPLIAALIQKLPKDANLPWPVEDRLAWLQMTAMAFQMAYGAVETIEIKKA